MIEEEYDDRPDAFSPAERELVIFRTVCNLIETHKHKTGEVIDRHIAGFETLGATYLANFWRELQAAFEQHIVTSGCVHAPISPSERLH